MHPDHADELDGVEFDALRAVFDDLDTSDVDLVDPPAAIWAGIDASAASEAARRAPGRMAVTSTVVEYTIDADDAVVGVGGQWAEFANDNGAAELVAPPVDRTLWSYFDQPEVRELWQMVVSHVRTHEAPARLPFRCDAPQARRWFEMSVSPVADGHIHFRSELVFEEERTPVALLDATIERAADDDPVTVCTWCGRGDLDGAWVEIDELLRSERLLERSVLPAVAWSICTPCRDDMTAELLVAGGITDTTDTSA